MTKAPRLFKAPLGEFDPEPKGRNTSDSYSPIPGPLNGPFPKGPKDPIIRYLGLG